MNSKIWSKDWSWIKRKFKQKKQMALFFYFVCFQIPVILLHHIDKILRVW